MNLALVTAALLAARITNVADAGDERHPLEVDLEATYQHLRTQTLVTREQTTAGGIQLHDEFTHVRTVDVIDLRLAIGLWHDLELHGFAPLYLRDQQDWTASAQPTLSASPISVSGGVISAQPIVHFPGQSQRKSFGDPTVGIAWGPVNEEREARLRPELFPAGHPVSTWKLGLDWTFPLPGAPVNDPTAPAHESRKAHVFTAYTAFSKRFRVLEPFAALSASVPFAARGAYDNCSHPELLADVAAANCPIWAGQTGYKPPIEAQFTLGTELVAAEDALGDQRLSFEVRGDLRWHGSGRDYSQVSDPLRKLTSVDEYVTTGGALGIYGRLARWFHLRVEGSVAVDSAHFLTHEDIGSEKDGKPGITISGGSGQPAPDQNPVYDFRLDPPGRRLRAEPAVTLGLSGTLSLNF